MVATSRRRSPRKGKKKNGKSQNDILTQRGGFHPLIEYLNFSKPSIGLPAVTRMKLRYCDYYQLIGATGLIALRRYGANCLYDPDVTGGGHQPYGFDQMMTYYGKSRVVKSRVDIQVAPTAVSVIAGVNLANTLISSTISTISGRMEYGRGTYGIASPLYAAPSHFESTYQQGVVFKDADPADMWNTVGANPSQIAYYETWIAASDGASSATVDVVVSLEYDVEFKEPNVIVTS